ncbi:MAG: hypothetical protein WB948_03880 [Desulfobaccales bacterium]
MLPGKLNYKTFKILLVGVLVCLPLGLSPATVSAQTLEKLSSLKGCSLLSDQELAGFRGSYDSYAFSMNTFEGPLGAAPAFTTLTNTNGPNGLLTAGVNGSLGPGIYQAVSVAGNNNMVISSSTITITHK